MSLDPQYAADMKAIEDGVANDELTPSTAEQLRRDAFMALQRRKAEAARQRNLNMQKESNNGNQ